MTKSDAQRFTELTGGIWHELLHSNSRICTCGLTGESQSLLFIHISESNPTYSNAADILNRMKEFCGEERYAKFIGTLPLTFIVDKLNPNEELTKKLFISFIDTYILNTPALLKKSVEFLEVYEKAQDK